MDNEKKLILNYLKKLVDNEKLDYSSFVDITELIEEYYDCCYKDFAG